MSGSAICFTQNPKIAAASRNMHITGKEKTSAAKPVQEVPADGAAVSGGDADVGGTDSILPSSFPEHFIHLIILRGGDAGTSPPVQTNTVPASCRLETHVLIRQCVFQVCRMLERCLF